MVDVSGDHAARFAAVKDAFAANFEVNGDVGASVAGGFDHVADQFQIRKRGGERALGGRGLDQRQFAAPRADDQPRGGGCVFVRDHGCDCWAWIRSRSGPDFCTGKRQ